MPSFNPNSSSSQYNQSTLKPSDAHLHRTSTNPSSSASSVPKPQTPTPSPAPTHGIRHQIHTLLPRHALFHVKVHIHDINNIPFVDGAYCARWKFKNVQSVPGHKSAALRNLLVGRGKGAKARGKERDEGATNSSTTDLASSGRTSEDSTSPQGSLHSVDSHMHPPAIPSVIVSDHHRSSSTSSSMSSINNRNPSAPSISTSSTDSHQQPHQHPSRQPTPSSHLEAPTPRISTKGSTPFVPLVDHCVVWDHPLEAVVKMDVDRETSVLLEHEMKISIKQNVLPQAGVTRTTSSPRLGVVYINLAEYADEGPVTRRHLLIHSRTNATLKLTIHVEHLQTDKTTYQSPPLPKAEILGGVTGFLDEAVFRTRPQTLKSLEEADDYESSSDDEPLHHVPPPSSRLSSSNSNSYFPFANAPSFKLNEKINGKGGNKPKPSSNKDPASLIPYDLDRLPFATSHRSTEAIIEALFNPLVTTSVRHSPFTVYQSPQERKRAANLGANLSSKGVQWNDEISSLSSGASSDSHGGPVGGVLGMTNGPLSPGGWEAPLSWNEGRSTDQLVDAGGVPKPRWWNRTPKGSRPGTPVGF